MRIYSHVITIDTGLAPNPFHGFCTSAVCTPSHKSARLNEGDWLIGTSPRSDMRRLVYAMRIFKKLEMDDYFSGASYQCKKPRLDGEPYEQCGDNLYYRRREGKWYQLPSYLHTSEGEFEKDVGRDGKGRPVFVSEHFYYFGENRIPIPDRLIGVMRNGQGLKVTKEKLAYDFVTWLEANNEAGLNGMPRDMRDYRGPGNNSGPGCGCSPRPRPKRPKGC